MSFQFYDTSKANELAKFQGKIAGIQAVSAPITGTASAATSIYNQAGYFAMQDTDSGLVSLQKLAQDSTFTGQWYDQNSNSIFDFSKNGKGITSLNKQSQTSSSSDSFASNSNSTDGLSAYPWGNGYTPNTNIGDIETDDYSAETTEDKITDENGNPVVLTAADINELVNAGIYPNANEALKAALSEGYTVQDSEQAKLGIYSEADESKIQLMMGKYGISREEAINKLAGQITPKADESEIINKISNMLNTGFSYDEAIDYLTGLGYEIPEHLKEEPVTYSEEDEAKISALMQATGCSRDEAVETLGITPPEPEKVGIIRKGAQAVCNFFKGIGKGISNAWKSFTERIW